MREEDTFRVHSAFKHIYIYFIFEYIITFEIFETTKEYIATELKIHNKTKRENLKNKIIMNKIGYKTLGSLMRLFWQWLTQINQNPSRLINT